MLPGRFSNFNRTHPVVPLLKSEGLVAGYVFIYVMLTSNTFELLTFSLIILTEYLINSTNELILTDDIMFYCSYLIR